MASWPGPDVRGVITRTAPSTVSPVSQTNAEDARNGYCVSLARVFIRPDGTTISWPAKCSDRAARRAAVCAETPEPSAGWAIRGAGSQSVPIQSTRWRLIAGRLRTGGGVRSAACSDSAGGVVTSSEAMPEECRRLLG